MFNIIPDKGDVVLPEFKNGTTKSIGDYIMKIEVLGIKIHSNENVFNIVVGKEVPHFPEESILLDEFEVFPSTEWISVACKKDRLYIGTVNTDYDYNTIVFVKDTNGVVEDIIVETY